MPDSRNRNRSKLPAQSFRILAFCLVVLLLLPAHLPATMSEGTWFILLTACLLACLYLCANRMLDLLIGASLAVAAFVIGFSSYVMSQNGVIVTSTVLYLAFFLYIAWFIARFLYHATQISEDMIFAAACLYVIAGLIWGFGYFLIELLSPGSFSFASTSSGTYAEIDRLTYFSFVTITSVGFGEITPVSKIAQSWTTIEALFGQLYVSIVLARLVSLQIASGNPEQ